MIENASLKDLDSIYKLGLLIHPNFKNNYKENALFNEFTRVLVYKIEKKIVGFIQYEIMYETVNIVNIVVDEHYRNQKIATLLLDYMLSDLCNKVIDNIMLEVSVLNIPAINLYKKFNFEIINTRKKYYNGIDAYIMERKVSK